MINYVRSGLNSYLGDSVEAIIKHCQALSNLSIMPDRNPHRHHPHKPISHDAPSFLSDGESSYTEPDPTKRAKDRREKNRKNRKSLARAVHEVRTHICLWLPPSQSPPPGAESETDISQFDYLARVGWRVLQHSEALCDAVTLAKHSGQHGPHHKAVHKQPNRICLFASTYSKSLSI